MKPAKLIERFAQNLVTVPILVPLVATVLWTVLMLKLPGNALSGAFSLVFLTTVPGYVLYRAIAGYPPGQRRTSVLGYAVGLSLLVLMLIGLGLNQLLPLLGRSEPLVAVHLVPAIAGFVLLATLAAARSRQKQAGESLARYLQLATWRGKRPVFWWQVAAGALLLVMPLVAVGGAIMLNNGGSNWLAILAVGLVALTMLGLLWSRKTQWEALYPLGLYSVALTLLLSTSMRGWEVTGHDIMQEFQVFQLTNLHSLWDMKFYQDAYMACLSITILPTVFQKLSGMYDPYIFKFVFQAIFALIAPLLFSGLRAYVSRKTALLAAMIFMTFPAFLTDITMLNRQEIAILFFALALWAALDRGLSKVARHILMIALLGGMVLSHYSTSYIAASILTVATVLGFGLWLLRDWLAKLRLWPVMQPKFTIFPAYVTGLVLLMIVGWSGLATHTAGNIGNTLAGIGQTITRFVNPEAGPRDPVQVDQRGTPIAQYAEYMAQTRPLPASEYYPDSVTQQYQPIQLSEQSAPLTPVSQVVGLSAPVLQAIYNAVRQGYVVILAGFLAVGLGVILLRRATTPHLPIQYVLLGVACLIVMVLQLVLPSEVNYGLARVIQQSLVILGLPAAVGVVWLLGRLHVSLKSRFRVAGLGLVALFVVLSGLLPTLTGGFKPALAFSNSGFYYQAYYTHPDEIRADQWLAANAPKGSRVYADEFSRRRLITYAGIFAEPTLVPNAIPVDSYVYLSRGNTTTGQVPVYYQGQLLFYNTPIEFLVMNKSLLYNSGGVQIYK